MHVASSKRLKVCHVVSSLDTGGMENGVVNLCNGHDRSLVEPIVCCLKHRGAMVDRLLPDVRFVCLDLPEGKGPLRPLAVSRFFRNERPDIVHTHGWGGGAWDGVIGAKLAGCPVVINGEHGTLFTGRLQITLQRLVAALCDRIFCVSPSLCEKIVDTLRIPPDKITVIANGVDMRRFHGRESSDESGPAAEKVVICTIGTLKPHKNQMLTIKAVQGLVRSGIGNLKLLVVGDGPDCKLLTDYVENEGLGDQVSLLGKRDDIPEILASADILVSSSKSEAFSNVVLEAMSAGLPVISTRSYGTEEIIVNGESGFLIDPGDLEALTERLRFLVEHQTVAREFGQKGRAMVAEKYSIERMVRDYEQEYLRLYCGAHALKGTPLVRGA